MAALLDSSFPLKKLAFAASCLLDPQGNVLLDPEGCEEASPSLNRSEHFVVYDPENFDRSLAMEHFGKFEFDHLSVIKNVLIQEGILPINEVVKSSIIEKLNKKL